jgi:hypothetical protein
VSILTFSSGGNPFLEHRVSLHPVRQALCKSMYMPITPTPRRKEVRKGKNRNQID